MSIFPPRTFSFSKRELWKKKQGNAKKNLQFKLQLRNQQIMLWKSQSKIVSRQGPKTTMSGAWRDENFTTHIRIESNRIHSHARHIITSLESLTHVQQNEQKKPYRQVSWRLTFRRNGVLTVESLATLRLLNYFWQLLCSYIEDHETMSKCKKYNIEITSKYCILQWWRQSN